MNCPQSKTAFSDHLKSINRDNEWASGAWVSFAYSVFFHDKRSPGSPVTTLPNFDTHSFTNTVCLESIRTNLIMCSAPIYVSHINSQNSTLSLIPLLLISISLTSIYLLFAFYLRFQFRNEYSLPHRTLSKIWFPQNLLMQWLFTFSYCSVNIGKSFLLVLGSRSFFSLPHTTKEMAPNFMSSDLNTISHCCSHTYIKVKLPLSNDFSSSLLFQGQSQLEPWLFLICPELKSQTSWNWNFSSFPLNLFYTAFLFSVAFFFGKSY